MDNKKITAIAASLVALVAVGGLALSSFAQNGSDSAATAPYLGQKNKGGWQNLSEEAKAELEADRSARRAAAEVRREAVKAAMASGDYNAWAAAHDADDPMLEMINLENFPKLIQAHDYFESGREIMAELGIEKGQGQGWGKAGSGAKRGACGRMMLK